MNKKVLMILLAGLIISLIETCVVSLAICFIFNLTWTFGLMLKVWVGLWIINVVFKSTGVNK